MIEHITSEIFSREPKETLYHYTTFKGLFGIVESRSLWASDIRYMNDAAEFRHTVDLVRKEIKRRINNKADNVQLLNAFADWLSRKLTNGHLLFACSFRENGNLLSQWRGYSSIGKGVSLGFNPDLLSKLAKQQGFKIARCIYNPEEQAVLIAKLVNALEELAVELQGLDYEQLFDRIEADVLTITAILKHPSFQEESEWRVISPSYSEQSCPNVKFREGTSVIVPYLAFELSHEEKLPLQHVFLGPSPNSPSSINSLKMFLARHDAMPMQGISNCKIPFRAR